MVRQRDTHYAKGPEGNIAYLVVGDGPIDLVIVPGWFSHLDVQWGSPLWRSFVEELASFARVILYDKLGTGLSDPLDGMPTLESRVDDLRAVLDVTDSQRAALFGISEGGPISALFAATHPTRVHSLILYGTLAGGPLEDDGSTARARWLKLLARIRSSIDQWGEGMTIDWAAPSLRGDADARMTVGGLSGQA